MNKDFIVLEISKKWYSSELFNIVLFKNDEFFEFKDIKEINNLILEIFKKKKKKKWRKKKKLFI